jgi:hypothetical protein
VHCRSKRGRSLQRVPQLQSTRPELLLARAILATKLRLADVEGKYSGILTQSALCGQGWYLAVSLYAASVTKADIVKQLRAARTSRLQSIVNHFHALSAQRLERLSINVLPTVLIMQRGLVLLLAPLAPFRARL